MVAWNERREKKRVPRTCKPVQPTFVGFKVRKTGKTGACEIGYILIGKMGARYSLVRTALKPYLMFAVNRHGNTVDVAGFRYFRDDGGSLRGA